MNCDRDRIVLVRPQGGLNDTLKQIESCCRYAESFGRKVVVDTAYSGSKTFHDSFSNFFSSKQKGLVLDVSNWNMAEERDVFPSCLSGRLTDYRTSGSRVDGFYRDMETGEPITFNFRSNYFERVVVHHQSGGGDSSSFFQRVSLNDELRIRLSERLAKIGPNYLGIHIRNTDYQTNFKDFIDNGIRGGHFKNRRVFLATDSLEAKDYFIMQVNDLDHLEVTCADLKEGQPLHIRSEIDSSYWRRSNSEAILDLLTLAYSAKISAPPLENPKNIIKNDRPIFSGFAQLAMRLHSNRPLLTSFTGIQGWLDV